VNTLGQFGRIDRVAAVIGAAGGKVGRS